MKFKLLANVLISLVIGKSYFVLLMNLAEGWNIAIQICQNLAIEFLIILFIQGIYSAMELIKSLRAKRCTLSLWWAIHIALTGFLAYWGLFVKMAYDGMIGLYIDGN